MRIKLSLKTLWLLPFSFLLCNSNSEKRSQSLLDRYDLDSKKVTTIDLPGKLREISGLAITKDNRLFGHDDERGVIYQIDLKTGEIIKKFMLGKLVKKADFEGIAISDDYFYLVTSDGKIVEFTEGKDGGSVDYKVYHTNLKQKNDVEGLCYDWETHSLLLACKGDAGENLDEYKAVYSFSLKTKTLSPKPRFLIKKNRIARESKEDEFKPSGIEKHPVSGSFFIIASEGNIIIEISKEGEILSEKRLSRDLHQQPEGIVFTSDNSLVISDEGKKKGSLTIYPKKTE